MTTYAEYLKSQGATDDEVAVLNTPVAQRAYAAMEAQATKAVADAAAAMTQAKELETRTKVWYDDQIIPEYKKLEADAITAKAELARARALIQSATDQGLLKIAENMGYKADGTPSTPTAPAAADPRYVTMETLTSVAEREGDAIAIAQDIAFEHRQLFPDRPLNFRELRREAVAARKSVEQLWQEKYGVVAAREKAAADAKAGYEARLIKQGEDAALAKYASEYGNPNTRPLAPSTSPFAARPVTGRDKQPWERTDSAEAERVSRATKHAIEVSATRAN